MRNFILTFFFAALTTLAICGGAYLINEVMDKPALAVPGFVLCATIVASQAAMIVFFRWLRENDYI